MLDKFIKNPFVFAAIICVCGSLLLSLCAEGLRPIQEKNVKVDIQRNILLAVGISGENGSKLPEADVETMFEEKLRFQAIDEEGNPDEDVTSEQIAEGLVTDRYPLYVMEDDGAVSAYVVPMVGQGLWGPISGYLALEPDCDTIRGVTFFTKMETPGLGAEIATADFQNQYKGKRILDDTGALVSVTVVKGEAAAVAPDTLDHAVDGLSGATITGDGVTDMFAEWLGRFEPYFAKVRTN